MKPGPTGLIGREGSTKAREDMEGIDDCKGDGLGRLAWYFAFFTPPSLPFAVFLPL